MFRNRNCHLSSILKRLGLPAEGALAGTISSVPGGSRRVQTGFRDLLPRTGLDSSSISPGTFALGLRERFRYLGGPKKSNFSFSAELGDPEKTVVLIISQWNYGPTGGNSQLRACRVTIVNNRHLYVEERAKDIAALGEVP